jgi:DNA ligase (NAD+)
MPHSSKEPVPSRALTRAQKLRELILYHQKRYHEDDAPEISDTAYDSLVREYEVLEHTYPSLSQGASVTARVGGAPSAAFTKVEHKARQWSFDNCFTAIELEQW